MGRRAVVGLLAVLLVAVGGTGVYALTLRGDVARLEAEVARAEAERDAARAEADDLRGAPPADPADPGLGALDGLLEGLLGGGSGGGLDDLLGGLGGLGGGSGAPLAQCVTGDGAGGGPIPAQDVGAQIAAIAERVEALRGLEAERAITPTFLTGAEIQRRVTDLVLADYPAEEADLDQRLLSALAAIPPGTDLRALQAELVSGQVAGYYDTESGELVVRDDGDAALDAVEQVTLAHEVEHAIADQVLGLAVDDPDQPTDAARAGLAVVEGDATLTMQQFAAQALDLDQQLALAADPEVLASQEQLDAFPHAVRAPLLFSYTEGLAFVCARYAEGGWAAVNAAYERRPATTAEILFPARYPLAPAAPRPPGSAGAGWAQRRSDTFGAADLLWLFEAPGDDEAAALDRPRERAGDWAGGTVAVSTRGEDTAVGLALVGGAGGPPLCDSVADWYEAATGAAPDGDAGVRTWEAPGRAAALACDGAEVRLGIAPDLPTATALTR